MPDEFYLEAYKLGIRIEALKKIIELDCLDNEGMNTVKEQYNSYQKKVREMVNKAKS